jgi:hypothetical protein
LSPALTSVPVLEVVDDVERFDGVEGRRDDREDVLQVRQEALGDVDDVAGVELEVVFQVPGLEQLLEVRRLQSACRRRAA